MSKFTKVLRNPNFFLLWLGQIISQLGDRLDQMALIALVYSRAEGSTIGIAKVLSFTIIPVFLIGPVAGVYVDRWDKRRTMYVCDFLRAGLVLLIPLFLINKSFIWIYPIIFVIFSIGRFFVPAKLAIIPELVDKDDLLIANSLVSTTGMIAAILGFGVSGIVVEWLKAAGGFYLDSLSFLISGTMIFLIAKKFSSSMSISKVSKEIVEVIRKSVAQEIKEGLVYFARNKHIRTTGGIIFALWSALGAVYVVIIVFVQKTLHSATKDLGLLIMFLGIGLFLGSLVYGRFGQRVSQYRVIFISLILSGLMLIIFAVTLQNYPMFIIAATLALSLGICVSPIMIATNTIIHKVSDNEMMGKVFSSLEMVMHLAFLIFMFLSSFLAERWGNFTILVIVGCVFSLMGALNLALQRKIKWIN
jgi:MFS family permease